MNDDLVVVGDYVGVLSDDASAGIYTVQEDGTLYRVTTAAALRSVDVPWIVVQQGCYHNNILY